MMPPFAAAAECGASGAAPAETDATPSPTAAVNARIAVRMQFLRWQNLMRKTTGAGQLIQLQL
jgi:hypothetical protein